MSTPRQAKALASRARTRTEAGRPTQTSETDLPALTLIGEFPSQVTVVPRSLATLLMCMGFVEEERRRHVLLPHVEMRFSGIRQGALNPDRGPDQELEELFSRVLPLENALWLLSDLARDIRSACLRLRDVTAGSDVLERVRIAQARDYADQLHQQAELTAALLGELVAGPRASDNAAPESAAASEGRKIRKVRRTSDRSK